MNEQSILSDIWYACVETKQEKNWICQGPYNTAQLADAFFKDRLNTHKTMLVNSTSYLPPIVREHSVRQYIYKAIQPTVFFIKPTGEDSATSTSSVTSPPVEWAAH